MRKMTLLFAALLSLASTTTKAETLTANFDSELPAGWSIVGDLTRNSDRARSGSGIWTSSKSDNANYLVTEPVEGSIRFYARAYNKNSAAYVLIYAYDGTALGDKLYESANMRTSSTPSFSSYTANLGDYKGQVAIALNYTAIDDVTYTQMEAVVGPALTVKDNGSKVLSPYACDFGLTTAGTQRVLTLSNPGTEDLGVSISETGNFSASLSAATIAAGGEVTLTLTMPDVTGSSQVTVIPADGSGIDPFIINVSGTVRDPNKVYLDFADGQMPEGWTAASSSSYYNWTVSEGSISYSASSSSYAGTFTSPMLSFAKDEQVFFETSRYGSSTWYSPSVKVEYSLDGEAWTAIGSAFTDDVYGTWTQRSATIPVEGVKYIRFNGWYISLRNIYGGELPKVAKMVVTQPESLDFGIITEQATKTFTIANTGRAALEGISVTATGDAVFSVTGAPSALAAGESAEVTVAMAADAAGVYSTAITVGADGMEPVSFTLTGAVMPEDALVVSFDDNQLPAGWTAGGSNKWSYADGKAYCTSAAELTSPQLVFAEGDFFIIKATSYDNYDNNYIEVSGSADGSDWTAFETRKFVSRSQIPYGSYGTLVVKDIPTTVKYIKLKGYYVRIDEIAGLTYNQDAPQMSFAAEDFAAGKVAQSTSKTYTVSNSGTGTLTVNIASDDEHFTVSPAQLVITDEPKDFTVTFNYQEGVYGKFSADITVTPTYDETAAVSFAATAQVVDPNLWEEDFEAGTLPTGWVATGWTIGSNASYENTSKMALAPSSSSAGTLTTPCLTAKQGDVLTWDAYLNWYDEALTVEYSADGQQTWTQICTYKAEDDGISTRYSHKAMSFTAPADGDYYLRFTSTYQNGVDNFSGFKLNLPDHILSIAASSIPASSQYYMQMKEGISFNATVTLAESRGVNEEVTVRFYMDDEVIGTATETVEAGSSKAITIVCTPTKPATEGAQMHIEVEYAGGTLTTEPEVRYVAAVVRLDLAEAEETEIATGTTFDVVTLKRTFAEGWNTFVSPLSVSLDELGEGAAAYTFTGYADGVLTFSKVSGPTLNPATPYIVYVPARLEDKTFTWQNVSISSLYVGDDNVRVAKDGVIFQGTYAPVAAPGMEGKYGVTPAAKIAKGTAGASIKGFRAYLELPEGAEVKALAFDGDGATAVEMVNGQWSMVNEIYNLGGQRLGKMQRGINIVNGKKVLK